MLLLRHPNVVSILGISENPPFIVLPYMQKRSLQNMINDKVDMSLELKLKYLCDAAKGNYLIKIKFRTQLQTHKYNQIIPNFISYLMVLIFEV